MTERSGSRERRTRSCGRLLAVTREVALAGRAGLVALVDDADYEVIAAHRWTAITNRRTTYAIESRPCPCGSRRQRRMHNVIMDAIGVDHRNGDGLDNRRENLRRATHSQNMRNVRKLNTRKAVSRYKGVGHVNWPLTWRARISVDGRLRHLGVFPSEDAAARAYDAAARVAFGEFAAVNFPEPGERSALA